MNIKTLKSELENKDELVQTLTQQLEQVAEQLDRVQRTGTRASSGGGGSLPPEFAKQHEAVAQDVSYLVEQWDATQIGSSIGRLEMQLQEMRDMIVLQSSSAGSSVTFSEVKADVQKPEPSRENTGAGSSGDYLASLQAAFLNPEEENPETVLEDVPENGSYLSTQSFTTDLELRPPEELPEQPASVNFDQASPEDLKNAVIERDKYIKIVIDQLSQARTQIGVRPPTDWETLQGCPDELIEHVKQLGYQLEDQLRLSEVSLSLERARLSREETQLNAAKIQMQKELRKQGIDPRAVQGLGGLQGEDEGEDVVVKEKVKGTKWLNMLRVNGKS